MKKSYIKLIIFMSFFSLLFIFNGFVYTFLSQIKLDILLFVLLIIAYILFGFEKDRHRYIKDIILELIIVLITFFLIYYLFGIVIGFAKVSNYYNINSILNIIIPIIIYIILSEILRYQLLIKSSESKYLIYLVCLFFIIMDTSIATSLVNIKELKDTFLLISLTILPSISKNILCTYLSLNFGYKPCLLYVLVMSLYSYLLPLVPNPNEYVYSLIFLILPLWILFHIRKWTSKDKVNNVVIGRFDFKRVNLVYYIPLIIITFILVYFISGYFRYYAVAIASGSMEPVLSRGDVVVVDQEYKSINVGDILAYNYDGKVVVHRIYKIIDTNKEYYIYTKGDANNSYDKYKISKNMLIGIVKFKIPLIGYPTVLLNEIW